MAKWADYLISGVHYTITDKKISISHVHVHEFKNDSVGGVLTLTRGEIINKIDNHNTFKTIFKNDGQWEPGEDVRKVKTHIYYYLRTDSNNKEEDNLGDLPQF
jgi:Protein of unknown function (DUF3892)